MVEREREAHRKTIEMGRVSARSITEKLYCSHGNVLKSHLYIRRVQLVCWQINSMHPNNFQSIGLTACNN